jgi:hypothetical protein
MQGCYWFETTAKFALPHHVHFLAKHALLEPVVGTHMRQCLDYGLLTPSAGIYQCVMDQGVAVDSLVPHNVVLPACQDTSTQSVVK